MSRPSPSLSPLPLTTSGLSGNIGGSAAAEFLETAVTPLTPSGSMSPGVYTASSVSASTSVRESAIFAGAQHTSDNDPDYGILESVGSTDRPWLETVMEKARREPSASSPSSLFGDAAPTALSDADTELVPDVGKVAAMNAGKVHQHSASPTVGKRCNELEGQFPEAPVPTRVALKSRGGSYRDKYQLSELNDFSSVEYPRGEGGKSPFVVVVVLQLLRVTL
ncbi:hypothetical protein C8R46DRAFT_1192197 [Mycena filopes]|nr:hypothetical protein C8R46DRAFT_1192197 [Mycena filopes]